MRNYLKSFFERYEYPSASVATMLEAYDILSQNGDFNAVVDLFYAVEDMYQADIERAMVKVSDATGVNLYTTKFLYWVCISKELPKLYAEKGYPEEIMWASLEDLRYKFYECMEVHGVPGCFCGTWFYGFFRATMFSLGRMQYHIISYKGEPLELNGQIIKSGDLVLNTHIPSNGMPFDKAARYESYETAYRFFKDVVGQEVKLFHCHSWLLYSKNQDILPEKSNIRDFRNDFKIVLDDEYKDPRANMWRIFGKYGEAPIEELPRDSSLRRAYADFLATGAHPGCAKGLFVWDDVNKKPITE